MFVSSRPWHGNNSTHSYNMLLQYNYFLPFLNLMENVSGSDGKSFLKYATHNTTKTRAALSSQVSRIIN